MGCTRARVRARGPTHPLCTRTPDDGLDEGGGWFLAEGRREREGGREGGREQGNRDIDSTRDTAGCFRAWSLASSTFDNFDNANYRMTN